MNLVIVYVICLFICVTTQLPTPETNKTENEEGVLYNQKQTGDYNVRLHLKDFAVVAVVNEDPFAGLGDYDYSYDYSDFTVKPPQTAASLTSTTTTTTSAPSVVVTSASSLPTISSSSAPVNVNKTEAIIISRPDQIPVNIVTDNSVLQASASSVANVTAQPPTRNSVSIVPAEDVGGKRPEVEVPVLGEIVHYRRCSTGYARDKSGRCRKVRRPVVPLDLSRYVTNLSKLAAAKRSGD
jgi:hypothetical protein